MSKLVNPRLWARVCSRGCHGTTEHLTISDFTIYDFYGCTAYDFTIFTVFATATEQLNTRERKPVTCLPLGKGIAFEGGGGRLPIPASPDSG